MKLLAKRRPIRFVPQARHNSLMAHWVDDRERPLCSKIKAMAFWRVLENLKENPAPLYTSVVMLLRASGLFLYSAIEKLKRGLKINQLTPDEQIAHRAYRRQQRRELWERTPEEKRKELRAKWRERWYRQKNRTANLEIKTPR